MYLTYILQPYFNCLLVPGVLCGFFWIVYIDKHIICEQKWFILFFLMYMPFIILLCLVLASTSTIMLKKRSFQSLLFQKYFLFFSLSFLILVFPLWLFYTFSPYMQDSLLIISFQIKLQEHFMETETDDSLQAAVMFRANI